MRNTKENNRKQFDVSYRKEIESGKYTVETEDGHQVKIINWNYCPGDYHIAGIVDEKIKGKNYITDGLLVLYNEIGASLSNKRFFLYVREPQKTLKDLVYEVWRRTGSSITLASFEEQIQRIIDFVNNEK